MARSLNNWAEMELLQGKASEAQAKLERALAIYAKLGLKTSQVAETLHHLAVVYQVQGKYTAAQTHLQRALALWEKERGTDHPTLVHPLQNYAELLRQMGREEEATKVEARVKDIRTNSTEADATTK